MISTRVDRSLGGPRGRVHGPRADGRGRPGALRGALRARAPEPQPRERGGAHGRLALLDPGAVRPRGKHLGWTESSLTHCPILEVTIFFRVL